MFPGISEETIRAFFTPPIRGVVLETFGAGNAPQLGGVIIEALKEAYDRGVVVVAITQCMKGSVSDAYEAGWFLLQAGIVPGGDMTPEVSMFSLSFSGSPIDYLSSSLQCTLTKLSYLLSKDKFSLQDVCDRSYWSTSARGTFLCS